MYNFFPFFARFWKGKQEKGRKNLGKAKIRRQDRKKQKQGEKVGEKE